MAVRILVVGAVLMVLYGCGQSSTAPEQGEKEGGQKTSIEHAPKKEEPKNEEGEKIPIDGAMGENIESPQFDYRTLDIYTTDEYYYMDDPSLDTYTDSYSQVGKFIVVSYSGTNTSSKTVNMNLGARLFVKSGSKNEVYEESDEVAHPRTGAIWGAGVDLAPREMIVGQFIFDVPVDVEPETLAVLYKDTAGGLHDVLGNVGLTEENPQGPRPEEILALHWEYQNMQAYTQAYELFAQESKDQVSEQDFVSKFKEDNKKYGVSAVMEYSFPSVDVQGDHATIDRVITYSNEKGDFDSQVGQDKATQEMVLENVGWRIVMRDEQVKYFLGGG